MQFESRKAKPWMRRHRWAGRIYAVVCLIIGPVVICAVAIWDERHRFGELGEIFRAAFGKWVEDDDQ